MLSKNAELKIYYLELAHLTLTIPEDEHCIDLNEIFK